MMERGAVAVIDELRCIGCALCIEACPVDAIVGASGWVHTVIENHCIGCDLCVPPCPVDCISVQARLHAWTAEDAAAAKRHARRRKSRRQALAPLPLAPAGLRRTTVAEALERARARRAVKRTRAQ